MSKDLSTKILDQIKSSNIQPKSKWKFTIKNWVLWIFYALFILAGGIGLSVVIFMVFSEDWEIYNHISDSPIEFLVLSFPYFWAILFLLFLVFSHFNFRKTSRGYKTSFRKLVFFSALLTLFSGAVSYGGGFAEKFEHFFEENVEYYAKYKRHQMQMWNNPDDGLLSGEIKKIDGNYFQIEDLNGNGWTVYISSETAFRGRGEFQIGSDIKIIGSEQGEGEFFAEEIRMWGGGPEMGNGMSRNGVGNMPMRGGGNNS